MPLSFFSVFFVYFKVAIALNDASLLKKFFFAENLSCWTFCSVSYCCISYWISWRWFCCLLNYVWIHHIQCFFSSYLKYISSLVTFKLYKQLRLSNLLATKLATKLANNKKLWASFEMNSLFFKRKNPFIYPSNGWTIFYWT